MTYLLRGEEARVSLIYKIFTGRYKWAEKDVVVVGDSNCGPLSRLEEVGRELEAPWRFVSESRLYNGFQEGDWSASVTIVTRQDRKQVTESISQATEEYNLVDLTVFYENVMGRVPIRELQESGFTHEDIKKYLKIDEQRDRTIGFLNRFVDSVLALVGLVGTAPFLVAASVLIWIEDRGEILFKQHRVGKNGEAFELLKLRTMEKTDEEVDYNWSDTTLPAQEKNRVTKVGAILRATKLDEMPQLVNIIYGQLRPVGPRPEQPEAFRQRCQLIELYEARCLISPGMAGWGLINKYESAVDKVEYDLWYIKNRSFTLDIALLLVTGVQALTGDL